MMTKHSHSIQLSPQGACRDNIILGILMVLFYVSTTALSPLNVPDEGRYPSIALSMLQNHDYVSTMLNGVVFMDKPALYYWLEAFSMHLFGISEWSIRLPMALMGISGVLLTQRVATIFYGRRTGWLAGIVLGTSLLYFISSHYADMDLEVGVWLAASLFFVLLGLQYPLGNTRRLLFYTAYTFAAAATMTKGLMGIVFPAMVLGLYSVFTREWRLIKDIYLPTGLLLFIALCAPWYVLMQASHPDFFNYFFIYQQFTRFTESGFNSGAPFWLYLPVIFLGMLPWSLFIPQALINACKQPQTRQPAFFLAVWVISIFLFFSIPSSKPVTYIMPIFPALAVLIACQINVWLDKRRACTTTYILSAVTAIIGIISLLAGAKADILSISTPKASHSDFILLGIISLLTAAFAFMQAVRRQRFRLIGTATAGLILMLACAAHLSGYFNKMSTKPLALLIKDKVTPATKIINYHQYFYDIPLYLNNTKPIIVVNNWKDRKKIMAGDNWRRELYFGMQSTLHSQHWLVQPRSLGKILRTHPSYVFTRNGDSDYLQKKHHLHIVAQTPKVTLLSNIPTENPKK